MEPIISKLQEGVKYPRFERDATTIINDLVEHITKERGVYSSSIEPNPSEHKVWFNTNNNTLNIYENGRWNTISGQGGGGGSSSGAIIDNATINTPTISGGNISGATISGGNINGATLGDITITYGSINNVVMTRPYIGSAAIIKGNIDNSIFNGGSIIYATISGGILTNTINASSGTISGATISGGNIDVNKVKAKSIETPLINLTSGSTNKSIQLLGDNYVFSGKLADLTLFHSIDLNSGSIAGLTSIKTLSYTGLTIEPYNATGTGTPITIHGKAAGLSLGVNSTAPFTLDGISSLNWKNGSSNGYMMTFNTNNNIINSNFDTFNITNGTIKLTSGIISGGTISGATINGATIGTGSAFLYAGSKILVTYTGSVSNPILMPNGGNIGYHDASLTLCGVTLTGGDFTKLKNLQ